MKFKHEPLNLYLNFKKSAEQFPDSPIIFDEAVGAFPELALETTYQKTHQAIVDKASLLSELGIKKSDKVIIFKSSAFDTYLLAVAVSRRCSSNDFLSSSCRNNGYFSWTFRQSLAHL